MSRKNLCELEAAEVISTMASIKSNGGIMTEDIQNRFTPRQAPTPMNSMCADAQGGPESEPAIGQLIASSKRMKEILNRVRQAIKTGAPVLIQGEPGTGKEFVASVIHKESARSGPLICVDCTLLAPRRLDGELFGHEQDVFIETPGAREGCTEAAEGGTLFLQEIEAFSLDTQQKLLRLIQEGAFERVGGNETRQASVRIIAASTGGLEQAVQQGNFSRNLYQRLCEVAILLPPLRLRLDDVLPLANHFAESYGLSLNKPISRISASTINALLAWHWPGNVRELKESIRHAVQSSTDGVIHSHNLPLTLRPAGDNELTAKGTLRQKVHALERDMIIDALKRANGSINTASRELGITSRMVRYKIQNLQIEYEKMFKRKQV